jgi:hypothetical protein
MLLALLLAPGASPARADRNHDHGGPSPQAGALRHPQLAVQSDGTVVAMWGVPSASHGDGGDLYIARWLRGDRLGPATRINDAPGSVVLMAFDEIRPSIATGFAGQIAVAWTDTAGDVRVAIGRDSAICYAPSIRLNQDAGKARQAFAVVTFDRAGGLHAAWLDGRRAKPGEEEPCDLFYARVADGRASEQDVSAAHSASVCSCCRPWIGLDAQGQVEILFRNTTPEGYRDIFRTHLGASGTFSRPEPVGPPLWKIRGCPAAGAVEAGGSVVWRDGSSGRMRLLQDRGGQAPIEIAVAAADSAVESRADSDVGGDTGNTRHSAPRWAPTRSARGVASRGGVLAALLAQGEPAPRLLVRTQGEWRAAAVELPTWCVSAASLDSLVLCAGVGAGGLKLQALPWAERR